MRKFFKNLGCLFISLTMVFGAFACAKKAVEAEDGKDSALGAGTYVINDFSTNMDLYQLLPQDLFGKINLNTNKDYYLTGSGSAKIEPNMSATTELIVKQRLISHTKEFNFSDLSRATKVTAQIYNASDTEIAVLTSLQFSNSASTSRDRAVLQPGQWNTVTYKVYPAILNLRYDPSNTMYVNYCIEKKETETQPVLYLDSISVSLTDEESEQIEISLDEGEFCSFDKNYQAFIPYPYGWGDYLERIAEMTLSADPTYTVGGKGTALKVRTTTSGRTDITNANRSWYYIRFPEDYCALAGLNKVKPGDKFTMSVYNASSISLAFVIQFRVKVPTNTGITTVIAHTQISGTATTYGSLSVAANSRGTYTVDFADLENYTKSYILKQYADQDQDYENFDVLANISDVQCVWGEFNELEERVFYVDDMRFIYGN